MEKTDQGYRLSSGREFFAYGGLISIARNDDGTFQICQGHDGALDGATGDCWVDEDEVQDSAEPPANWSIEERQELAQFMIAQWTAFKNAQG